VFNMLSELALRKANLTPLQERLIGMRAIITPQCPHCQSSDGQWRGYREYRRAVVHRRWCKTCGKWFIGGRHLQVPGWEELPAE
jgi:transposase-like protein